MQYNVFDVLATLFHYLITVVTKFRMLAKSEYIKNEQDPIRQYNNKQSGNIFLATTRSTQRYL
eukprot:2069482-Amphidinium_carterae.2